MSTSPKVSFGLYNLEISHDSTPSTESALQPFSKVMDLKTGNVTGVTYATYEPDFWLLDGGYKFLLENEAAVHVGLMSSEMSDENGDFANEPVLTVNFGSIHSSDGLVLHFAQYSGDYADSITVSYYDNKDQLISSDVYAPDAWEYEIDKVVNNFNRLVITFHSTNKPYRYLRLTAIDYGQLIHFTADSIKALTVEEQTDAISTQVKVGAMDLALYSTDPEFSIVNPTGYYSRLSQRQPLSVYEIVNDLQIFMGRYYLETWKNASDTELNFECIDAVGVLDRIPYHGGMWAYQGIKAQYLVDEIMQAAAIPYELDPDLYDVYVIGWIPLCSCREALQQVAFAIGGYVSCSRSNVVKIYKSPIITGSEPVITVTNAQKSLDQNLELKTLVTGVVITGHNYSEGSETVNLFEGVLAAGVYKISFSEPAHTLSISGAVVLFSNVNYAQIRVEIAGNVVITGLNYIDNQQEFSRRDLSLGSYVIENILSVKEATLINAYNGPAVTERVYNYYQQRYLQKFRLFGSALEIGQIALVDSMNGSQIRGAVERNNIDLAGGFISQTEVVGVVE